ncbi:MAG: patatin-like phospholipase family protein [Saprospiraceae bacterium]
MSKKAIILSGGGAKGAWGVGVVKALTELGNTYDIAIGTSTGSLIAPFILANDIQNLEQGYTSVSQNDIFNVNPFDNDGEIRPVKAGWRVITGKKTLGESQKLREKINELVTDKMLKTIRNQNRQLGVTVANLNKGISEVKSITDYTNDEMRDWIWASSNNPLFMSSFEFPKNDPSANSYADGGITNYANVEHIIKNRPLDLDHIDVIFHNTREVIREDYENDSGVLKRLLRVMDMFSAEVNKNDLLNAKLTFKPDIDISMNIYYMNDLDITTITTIKRKSLLFDKVRMQTGVMRGYTAMKNGNIDMDGCTIQCNDGRIVPNLIA